MKRYSLLLLVFILLAMGWQLGRAYFSEQERNIRGEVRRYFEEQFSDNAKQAQKKYTLKKLNFTQTGSLNVVLIHGLDDPGKVWMNLAPRLIQEQYNVWVMTYPNDQPISLSAKLFNEQLIQLKKESINKIIFVSHSMGGLIAREVLTNPEWQCNVIEKDCADESRPLVEKLIMVGTPNHGSELARFRFFAEIREQLEHLLQGNGEWLGWIFDGAGEAGIDLIPNSLFLTKLNARENPDDTDYHIIAGVIGYEEKRYLNKQLQPYLDDSDKLNFLDGFMETVGDGLVPLNSAILKNVPLDIVSGNHLSVIRNISRSSTREPPALPIIIDLLKSIERK